MISITKIYFFLGMFYPALVFCVEREIVIKSAEDPKTSQEAKDAFDEALKERKKAQQEIEENEKAYKKVNDTLKKQTYGSDDWKKWDKEATDKVEVLNESVNREDKWRVRQEALEKNTLVQEYAKEVGALLPDQPQLPSVMQRFVNGVKIWLKTTIQIPFNRLLGDKQKIIDIRNDLTQLYADIGPYGVLAKARNNKELASVVDTVEEKIATHIAALNDYSNAQKNNLITEQEKKAVQEEIESSVIDLLTVVRELSSVDQQTRKQIEDVIDKTLSDFGLSYEEKEEIYKKAVLVGGLSPEAKTLAKSIKDQSNELSNLFEKKPNDVFTSNLYNDFLKDVQKLEDNAVLKNVGLSDQVLIKYVVRNSYKTLYEGFLKALGSSESLSDPNEFAEKLLEIGPRYEESLNDFNKTFQTYLERSSQEIIGIQQPLAKDVVNSIASNLDQLSSKIVSEDSFITPALLEERYKAFDEAANNWLSIIDKSAVSQESLYALEIISAAYQKIWSDMQNMAVGVNIGKTGLELMARVLLKQQDIENRLSFEKSVFVIGLEAEPFLAKRVDRPVSQEQYIKQIENEEMKWRAQEPESLAATFVEIKKEPIGAFKGLQQINDKKENISKTLTKFLPTLLMH